jgi:hypothetical protein
MAALYGARIGSEIGRRWFEGLVAAEHVPAGDKDLAGDDGLGRIRLAGVAALDVAVEAVPGVVSRQAP